ncbi:inactive rhomboid protein 1-like [Watersipora subatra]|uniref:inactive rhomboid protein 1-like n=1 Tax=Watersipora subatra TaxID=2589382 RepID=UPI00355C579E
MPGNPSASYDTVTTNQPYSSQTYKRSGSRVDKVKRQLSLGLGLADQDNTDTGSSDAWLQRRAAFHGGSLIMGRGVSRKCKEKLEGADDFITMPTPRDPLHIRGTAYRQAGPSGDETDAAIGRQFSQSSALTRSSMGGRRRTLHKKDSVAKIAIDGLSTALGFRTTRKPRYSVQSRSLPPPSFGDLPEGDYLETARLKADTIVEEDSLDDEVFFDNKSHATSALDLRAGGLVASAGLSSAAPLVIPTETAELTVRPVAGGWRSGVEPKPAIPDTPGVNLDEPDFRFPTRMFEEVTATVLDNTEKRRFGEGIVGRLLNRQLKDDDAEVNIKDQLDVLSDHRPFFTYWITFVQIAVLIVSLSVYGVAPIGFGTEVISQDVLVTALYPETIGFEEPQNFWIGPRQIDLIHLGAKFAPCMRKDPNIADLHEKLKAREAETSCCIYTDNSGCYQSSVSDCRVLRAKWKRTSDDKSTVCGQDPEWCITPKGNDWPDDITDWPVCYENDNRSFIPEQDDHMSCNLLSRPCCIGVKGECQMLTQAHCDAKRGYFHANATLCSQVECLGKVCGLISFLREDHPDQFYRLWLSLILHAGVIHIVLTCFFQALIMRDMEKLAGAARVAIIYMGSGIGGNLASAIFLPYHVEVGPAGCQFGILATLWVEVIQSWQLIASPGKALAKVGAFTLALFLLGLLPWIDNYAHLFGFIFGLLLSFALLPYITFGSKDRKRKLIIKILSIILVILLYIILFIIFYIKPVTDCESCRYLNCIPFKQDFCKNMGVEIEATETNFEWQ